MSSIKLSSAMGRAESQFRDAFERLKHGKPQHLPRSTRVSQNNVAREAGVDPSALRKSRFPNLVAEIQQWLEAHGDDQASDRSARGTVGQRYKRKLRDKLEEMRLQRDDALSKLVDAEAHIVDLTVENQRLRAQLPPDNVRQMRPAEAGKNKRDP